MKFPNRLLTGFIGCCLLLLWVVGCAATEDPGGDSTPLPELTEVANTSGLPTLINHPRPALQVDIDDLMEQLDCTELYNCNQEVLAEIGCDELGQPNSLWGGLQPAYPIVTCTLYPYENQTEGSEQLMQELNAGNYISSGGGFIQYFDRYLILRDGQLEVLKNAEDVQAAFAPIESAEEALSYALASTGLSAYYHENLDPNFRYFTDMIADTHVVETETGYEVLLYDYEVFDCGPHTTSTLVVEVQKDGVVSIGAKEPAYEDPEEDGLCVD